MIVSTDRLKNSQIYISSGTKSEIEKFDIKEYVPYLLNQTRQAILPVFTKSLKRKSLSLAEWRILAALHKHSALRVRELLVMSALEPPTLSRNIANLEERGLIVRSPSEEDARGILVRATPDGISLAEALIPDAIAVQSIALRDFTVDETIFLISLLKRIYNNVEDHGSNSERSD